MFHTTNKPPTTEQKERAFRVCGIVGNDFYPSDVIDKIIIKIEELENKIERNK